jgi:hypothetical protein
MSIDKINQDYDCLFAFDCSYSIKGCNLYHKLSRKIISENDLKTKYIRWDNNVKECKKEEIQKINILLDGFGGTDPIGVADYIIKNNFKGQLKFISDGSISPEKVEYFSIMMKDWKFEKVYIYLVNNGSDAINESISCSLIRNSPHEVYIYKYSINDPEIVSNVNNDDINILNNIESISTVTEFRSVIDRIKNPLISMNMGTNGNNVIHSKLTTLKNKLIRSQSNENKQNTIVLKLIESFNLSPHSPSDSLSILSDVWNEYYQDSLDWIKEIDTMISWCNGSLKNNFSRSNITNREKRAVDTVFVPPETAEILSDTSLSSDLKNIEITCPISLDNSINFVILLKKTDTFFDIPDSFINNPLSSLYNEEFVNHLKSIFDCVISLESYKDLVDHGISNKSPLTRDKIFGALCLGKDPTHIKCTNSSLRHSLKDGDDRDKIAEEGLIHFITVL